MVYAIIALDTTKILWGKNKRPSYTESDKWPRIIQISLVLSSDPSKISIYLPSQLQSVIDILTNPTITSIASYGDFTSQCFAANCIEYDLQSSAIQLCLSKFIDLIPSATTLLRFSKVLKYPTLTDAFNQIVYNTAFIQRVDEHPSESIQCRVLKITALADFIYQHFGTPIAS